MRAVSHLAPGLVRDIVTKDKVEEDDEKHLELKCSLHTHVQRCSIHKHASQYENLKKLKTSLKSLHKFVVIKQASGSGGC